MTHPSEDLLATTEGVDEGSARSTAEGPDSTDAAAPLERSTVDAPRTDRQGGAEPAPPVDMESEDSRAARARSGSGQQLEAGEG